MKKDSTSPNVSQLQDEIRSMVNDTFEEVALLAKACGENLETNLAAADVDADNAERHLFRKVLDIGGQFMNLFLHHLTENAHYPRQTTWSGKPYECKVERNWQYRTVFGTHDVCRQLFYGEDDRIVPVAQAANLPERRDSYFLQELLSRLCVDGTYEASTESIADYFDTSFSTGSVDDIITEQARHSEAFYNSSPVVDPKSEGEFVFLQCDGKGVHLKGQTGKQESLVGCIGSVDAHVRDPGRLARGLVYPSLLEEMGPRQQPPRMKNPQYFGSLEMSKEEFF